MTVNMKIDLVGKSQRGLALGLNEFAGYASVAAIGFLTGYLTSTFGLKPYPFYLGIMFAILGFIISWVVVKDTRRFTALELKEDASELPNQETIINDLSFTEVFLQTSWKNRTLLAVSHPLVKQV